MRRPPMRQSRWRGFRRCPSETTRVSSTVQGGGKRRAAMTQISSPGEVPELLHKADGVIDRANGNSDEQGEDEAVEEVAESDARLVADRVRFFTREREMDGKAERRLPMVKDVAILPHVSKNLD